MIYLFENITPYQLLKRKYKGAEPTQRDKQLVENLITNQKLNYGVVNVLVDYVLKVNDNKLNKNFIETIAGQWKRKNIQTVEEAMKLAEKDHKKYKELNNSTKQVKSKKEVVDTTPSWFEKNLDKKQASIDEINEMSDILDNLI